MGVTVNRPAVVDVVPAGPVVATTRIYWDETKTRLLAEGHPQARFLAYAEGAALPATLVVEPYDTVGATAPVEAVSTAPAAAVAEVPVEPPPVARGRTRAKHVTPGVVPDTSIDGEAHVLAAEPGSPLRNGVDK